MRFVDLNRAAITIVAAGALLGGHRSAAGRAGSFLGPPESKLPPLSAWE